MTTHSVAQLPSAAKPRIYPEDRIAVLIPCYNEEAAIASVVKNFSVALPGAEIHVYDNNSHDRTIEVAQAAGAIIHAERLQGKGHVIRRMFADIDADVYVLVDGDGTYDAASANSMVSLLLRENLDMVVGCRVHQSAGAYRSGHQLGNAMLTNFVGSLFGKSFTDILSGYRVFSRRFVKSFPALSKGFEIETELTVHALELRMPIAEVKTPYGERMTGSVSKLHTYRDGFRILNLILSLYKHERPMAFFASIAFMLSFVSVALGLPIVLEWLSTGLVPRFPTAILASAIMILASLSVTAGLILETVTRGRQELKRLVYLQIHQYLGKHNLIADDYRRT